MAQLTAQGFQARTLEQIINEISGNLKAAFGTSFDTSPESPDGQLIGIFAEQIFLSEQASQAVYQSSDPDKASGEALEYVCDYNGVYRRLETPTRASVTFSGTPNTNVPKGVLVSTTDGLEFTTDHDVLVGTEVSVTCKKVGRFEVEANQITEIKTPVAGVNSVTNAASASAGTDRESDAAMRNRRAFSVVDRGSNTIESIYADVMKAGAEFVSIIQNVESTEVGGIPPHSFMVIVKGLDDDSVFKAISENKPAGIKSYGDIKSTFKDSKGYPHEVAFSRPKEVPIDVEVIFKKIVGSPNDTIDYITKGVTHDLNTFQDIGMDVLWSDIMGAAIYASNGGKSLANPLEDGIAASIRSVKINRKGATLGTNDIVIAINEKAVAGTITVKEA